MFCLIFAIVYGQLEHGEENAASDLEGAESANPQFGGYGGYGRGTFHNFYFTKRIFLLSKGRTFFSNFVYNFNFIQMLISSSETIDCSFESILRSKLSLFRKPQKFG